ncbi:hypothetical protein ACEQ8H_008873 [Pleosporales sp. CAS-2024a]
MAIPAFVAGIDLATASIRNIITNRIASRKLTRETRKRCDERGSKDIQEYQQNILVMLRNASTAENGEELAQKFRLFAERLENAKAISIALQCQASDEAEGKDLQDAWLSLLGGDTAYDGKSFACPDELGAEPSASQGLFHPLLIALLAYQMGGAVNAVFTARGHQWRLPEQADCATGLENFHQEGGQEDILSDHRMTLVWEEHDNKARAVSGTHHVFLGREAVQSHILQTACAMGADRMTTPSTVLYNPRSATIILVFGQDSLVAILNKLSTLTVPDAPARPFQSKTSSLLKRQELYNEDNKANIPHSVLNLPVNIRLSSADTSSPADFFLRATFRARRDVHMALGADMMPQNAIEDHRECARRYVRDMPPTLVVRRLGMYANDLCRMPYAPRDMMEPPHLHRLAKIIENFALQVMATGCVDDTFVLISLPCFVNALGGALDGPNATCTDDPLLIDEVDIQIYQTRCLYLFWCADWLRWYLENMKQGPVPLPTLDFTVAGVRGTMAMVSRMLLRNWAAWARIAEEVSQELR